MDCLSVTARIMEIARRLLGQSDTAAQFIHTEAAQPLLEQLGRLRACAVFGKAAKRCPAYRDFLHTEGYVNGSPPPVTTKENYIRPYGIASRCYDGRIPSAGVVIDESSGSSGKPNQWVRGPEDRSDVMHILQSSYRSVFPDHRDRILLNCFALGPWATGMNVSMAMADVGILISIGPDTAKLENALRTFGLDYHYLIFGYPPFLKDFIDRTALDLRPYHLDLVVGGEGMTERLRDRLLRHSKTVLSSYGASDLDINIGIETPFSIALRRRCTTDQSLCRALFGRDYPPMLFQYNPLDYVIASLPNGELTFTVARLGATAPKIRYNLHDLGGVLTMRELTAQLIAHGICPDELTTRSRSALPLLYIFGRSDLTVSFYGAKVFPSDLEEIIASAPVLAASVHSFQIATVEDTDANHRLTIALEGVPDTPLPSPDSLRDRFFEGLCRVNQDVREVSRLFDQRSIEVEVYPFATGPFAAQDRRIKNCYVASRGTAGR